MSNRGPKTGSPPKSPKSDQPRKPTKRRRLNPRAALALAVFVIVVAPGAFFFKSYQDQHRSTTLLSQAKKFLEEDQPNLALTFLNRYITLNPKDIDALDLKGKVLFELARTPEQREAAIPPNKEVMTADHDFKRLDTRRRLVWLNLWTGNPGTATTLALQLAGYAVRTDSPDLVKSPAPSPQDFRLLGAIMKWQGERGVAKVGDLETWQTAIENYEKAQKLDPGNVEGARSLADLYRSRRNDSKLAQQVLDQLLEQSKTPAQKAAAHSVRYDYFSGSSDAAEVSKAQAELDQAVRLQPENAEIQLKAALSALRRGEPEEARRHVEAVPAAMQARPELMRSIMAEIDWNEKNFDGAIQEWREGLKATGGTSDRLTWRLAYVLVRLGRLDQAAPLILQYHRLTDNDGEPTQHGAFLDAMLLLAQNQPANAIRKLEPVRYKAEESLKNGPVSGSEGGLAMAAEVATLLGKCYQANEQDQEALDSFRHAAKLVRSASGFKTADPWIGSAGILLRTNRLDEADAELVEGLGAIPGDPSMLIQLGRLRLAQQVRLSRDQRNWAPLEQILAQARKSAPNAAELLKLQVSYLTAENRLGEAATLLAAANDPKHPFPNPELWAMQAEVLRRLGKYDEASKLLDQATAALGEQTLFWISRANIESTQFRDKAAYEVLNEGVQRVPPDQRAALWRAMGDMHARLNDPSAARKAYTEWAKLAPADPEPQLLLLEVALAADDEAAVKTAKAAADSIGGLTQQLANALVLLKGRKPLDDKAREQQFLDADRIIKAIIDKYPSKPMGYLLQGQLAEQQGRLDDAIKAYRDAREHNGGLQAIRSLFILLARQHRFEDLQRLRTELRPDELAPELEQIAATGAVAAGDAKSAQQIIQKVLNTDPQNASNRIWVSQLLSSLGKPKDAEELLTTLIKQHPEDLNARLALMAHQINQKQFDQAAETLEQIRAQIKTERPEFIWAGGYWAIGNIPKASQYFAEAIQKWPDDLEVRQRAVAFFLTTNQAGLAEASLREVLKRNPKHGWARRELAQLLSKHREDPAIWREALDLIGEKPSADDTDEDRLVRATVLARSLNPANRQQAIAILEKLVIDCPGNLSAQAHDLLARLFLDGGQPDKAREHAKTAGLGSVNPQQIAFYIELLLRDNQLAEATRELERLSLLEPDSQRVIEFRTRALQAQGKGAEAASQLERLFISEEKSLDGETRARRIMELLLAIDQNDAAERVGARAAQLWPKSSWLYAQALGRRGKIAEALKNCRVAVDNGSALEGGTLASSIVTTAPAGPDSQARLAEAESIVNAALKKKPDEPTLLFVRAGLLRLQNRFAEVAQIYRTLLVKNPQNQHALNNLAWTLSEDLNQPEEGLKRIDAAISLVGRDPTMLDTRGVILTRLGRLDEAITDLETTAQKAPKGPAAAVALYHLARAYSKAGKTAQFQKYRDRAREAGLSASQLQPNERAELDKFLSQ